VSRSSKPRAIRLPLAALATLLVAAALLMAIPRAAQAAPAALQVYPVQPTHAASADYRLSVNGRSIPVISYSGYDIAQCAMGTGTATIAVTKINNTNIGAYSIGPAKVNYPPMNGRACGSIPYWMQGDAAGGRLTAPQPSR